MNRTGIAPLIVVFIAAGILLAGVVGYSIWKQPRSAAPAGGLSDITLSMPEWNVEFAVPLGMEDLQYSISATSSYAVLATGQLVAKGCALDQAPLGILSRVRNFNDFEASGHYIPENINIGGYYYYFTPPQAPCSMDKQMQELQAKQVAALKSDLISHLAIAIPSVTDTSDWKTFTSSLFNFSFKYPADWQKSNDPLNNVNPHVFFGHPLNGTTTYSLKLFIYDNPKNLSAADYVAQMLADDRAQDASNSANGSAPRLTPQFSKQFALTVGQVPAYELYDVFEFDHQAEQVYVRQGKKVILFDFPMPSENPNIANPAENNVIAHQILDSLQLVPGSTGNQNVSSTVRGTGAFCGGIAGVKCSEGYDCRLDGAYPDAGGTCEIQKVTPLPGTMCAQYVVKAKNAATGEIHDFPTPCEVPPGWEPVAQPG
ncbi:MAG: hypothetical protein KGJ13_04030 [Patescibacteria group bacterium]|nr:hypothetical protein [Patescibacteria group bacterium]